MVARLIFAAVMLCALGQRPDGSAIRRRAVPADPPSAVVAAGATLAPAATDSVRLTR